MNSIKKFAGIIWFLLAPVGMYFLIITALHEIEKTPVIDTKIQWSVFIIVFAPIAIGMMIFGYYAMKGEYDHLPTSSDEITD
ncbi:hypothetical protein FRZ67_14725 [Panacibacter ginsenosidivorans]|uniref:Uncharacterized protein n=1 Tax=Panacibacter ginsenosidivorans TaxID=1813871 RepID=A0A5B8VDX8_9BACT|nr:hypothetical protein [Panacibacter ginsenosidivorans]QEC68498.1 hypothetical protein FRZ67_14725 [Panacibacter ginsenosidivorans]